jgi:hypothetical protein
MRFPDDVISRFNHGTCLPMRNGLEAIGTEGSLFLDDPWHCRVPIVAETRWSGSSPTLPTRGRSTPCCCPPTGATVTAA